VASTLRALDYSIIQQCMHCGLCLPTCPTYDETKHERNSPRGRIALMRAVADQELAVTGAFADEMSYCLGCLACQTACPAGVNYAELLETARNDVEQAHARSSPGRSFWRGVTLGYLFMHPRTLRAAGRLLRFYQRSGMETLARTQGIVRLMPSALRRLEPQTPRIAPVFSNALIAPVEQPPNGQPRYTVALLTGCVQDLLFPELNRDTADVLLANGCVVYTPPVQPCCGSLHAHNGERELARTLARRMIDLVPPGKYDAIITNAGGCGSHLRHYSGLLGDDETYAARAHEWDRKVRDVHEWLVSIDYRRPEASPVGEGIRVTYHDSCHLAHGQKVVGQPRAIVRSLAGVSFVELAESAWCCGSAGIYNITQPEQSEKLLERKVRNVLATGASIVTTANPGCHLQILRGLRNAGAEVEVQSPVSLLARAYRAERAYSR
jgi:glycolate oxidase iron-sulfur subunit